MTVETPEEIRLTEHLNYVWANKAEAQKYPLSDEVRKIVETVWNERI